MEANWVMSVMGASRRPGRRGLLGGLCACAACGAVIGLGLAPWRGALSAEGPRTSLGPDEALAALREGNRRFVSDEAPPEPPRNDHERRLEVAQGQTPFATLVGCSDSRVPPELLFGRGLGELFIVRNAGNTVDTAALGSIEYAAAELGVPLILVMGHERCGAVAAAVEVVERNARFPGDIGEMIEPILPAVLQAKAALPAGGDLLEAAVRENVRRVAERLRTSHALLLEPQRAGRLKVVGAYYDLDDGRVDFFDGA
jgi:carbonic anhydrase